MNLLEFLAFVATAAAIYLVGTNSHKARNRGFGLGCLACVAWMISAYLRGVFWYGVTNLVLLFVYARGWKRTRPFAHDED